MIFKKFITILAIAAQSCFSLELVPIAKYEGQHSQKCHKASQLSGILVNDKIYTFGGCYPISYVVDPENDVNPFGFSSQNLRFNTTDTVYSYDIKQDIWTLESHTPMLMNGAQLQVVGTDIYLFDIHVEPDHCRSRMWKYATATKEWQVLDLPFIWRYQLVSCEHDGVIYFAGNFDGELRNIVQRYNTHEDQWLKPLFLGHNLEIHNMLCASGGIQILGKKFYRDRENEIWIVVGRTDEPQMRQFELYHTSSYEDGKVFENGFNVSMSFRAQIISSVNSFNIVEVFDKDTTTSKVDAVENLYATLGALDEAIIDALFVPYTEEEAFLNGGGQDNGIMIMILRKQQQEKKDALKTYNHRLKFIEEESRQTVKDEEQTVLKNVV